MSEEKCRKSSIQGKANFSSTIACNINMFSVRSYWRCDLSRGVISCSYKSKMISKFGLKLRQGFWVRKNVMKLVIIFPLSNGLQNGVLIQSNKLIWFARKIRANDCKLMENGETHFDIVMIHVIYCLLYLLFMDLFMKFEQQLKQFVSLPYSLNLLFSTAS